MSINKQKQNVLKFIERRIARSTNRSPLEKGDPDVSGESLKLHSISSDLNQRTAKH